MGSITQTSEELLHRDGTLNVWPPTMVPSFNMHHARQRGVDMNLLIRTIGGLGDLITAEPAIRYAIKNFKCAVSIETFAPEIYRHLEFNQIFQSDANDALKGLADQDKFFTFKTMYDPDELHAEFLAHLMIQRVDYHTLAMWRCQIPIAERCIELYPNEGEKSAADEIDHWGDVIIHAGETWPTRTFPVEWWQKVIDGLIHIGLRPVLIGRHYIPGRGVVAVDRRGCLDLVDKLSPMQTIAVCQKARVVLTNDSAPLHMAASGRAWIGFLSTVNYAEHVMHYRNGGQFGWRMKNFSKGCVFESFDKCPNRLGGMNFSEGDISSFLCDPWDLVSFASDKMVQEDGE